MGQGHSSDNQETIKKNENGTFLKIGRDQHYRELNREERELRNTLKFLPELLDTYLVIRHRNQEHAVGFGSDVTLKIDLLKSAEEIHAMLFLGTRELMSYVDKEAEYHQPKPVEEEEEGEER